jgi:hypothetical protein
MIENHFPYKGIAQVCGIFEYNFPTPNMLIVRRYAVLSVINDVYILMYGQSANTGKSEVFLRSIIFGFDEMMKLFDNIIGVLPDVKQLMKENKIVIDDKYSSFMNDKMNTFKLHRSKYAIFLCYVYDIEMFSSFINPSDNNKLPSEFSSLINDEVLKSIDYYFDDELKSKIFASKLNKVSSFNSWDIKNKESEYAIGSYVYKICKHKYFCKPVDFILLDFGRLGYDYGNTFTVVQIFESKTFSLFQIAVLPDRHNDRMIETYCGLALEGVYVLGVLHRDAKIIHNDTHIRNFLVEYRRSIPEVVEDFGMKMEFYSLLKPILIDFDLCRFKMGVVIKGSKNISTVVPESVYMRPEVIEISQSEAELAFAIQALNDIQTFLYNFKTTGGFDKEFNPAVSTYIDRILSVSKDYEDLLKESNHEYVLPAEYIIKSLNEKYTLQDKNIVNL